MLSLTGLNAESVYWTRHWNYRYISAGRVVSTAQTGKDCKCKVGYVAYACFTEVTAICEM